MRFTELAETHCCRREVFRDAVTEARASLAPIRPRSSSSWSLSMLQHVGVRNLATGDTQRNESSRECATHLPHATASATKLALVARNVPPRDGKRSQARLGYELGEPSLPWRADAVVRLPAVLQRRR